MTRSISVNERVCCRGGVRFESGIHRTLLETLKMTHIAAMSGTLHVASQRRGNALAHKQSLLNTINS